MVSGVRLALGEADVAEPLQPNDARYDSVLCPRGR